jgi:hypothetical protein
MNILKGKVASLLALVVVMFAVYTAADYSMSNSAAELAYVAKMAK